MQRTITEMFKRKGSNAETEKVASKVSRTTPPMDDDLEQDHGQTKEAQSQQKAFS